MLPYARKSKRMNERKKVKRELMMRRYCAQEGCISLKRGTTKLLSLEILLLNVDYGICGRTVYVHLHSQCIFAQRYNDNIIEVDFKTNLCLSENFPKTFYVAIDCTHSSIDSSSKQDFEFMQFLHLHPHKIKNEICKQQQFPATTNIKQEQIFFYVF